MTGLLFGGIDPGISPTAPGALAVIAADGEMREVVDMPLAGKTVDVANCVEFFRQWALTGRLAMVALEYQQSFPHQGLQSTFVLGQCYGTLQGILASLLIPFDLPHPAAWKRAMSVPKSENKDVDREVAKRLFPTADLKFKKNHGRADALLLAEYARRKHLGVSA